jgi:hypothetical protein
VGLLRNRNIERLLAANSEHCERLLGKFLVLKLSFNSIRTELQLGFTARRSRLLVSFNLFEIKCENL